MKKIVSLVGRTNVGKSSIFNMLTKSTKAIVSDLEGLTRDRKISQLKDGSNEVDLIDTGGFFSSKKDQFEEQIILQAYEAIFNSDLVIFVVDNKAGITPYDKEIAKILRKSNKNILLAINKIDVKSAEGPDVFQSLGFKEQILVSASHNQNISEIKKRIFEHFPQNLKTERDIFTKICIVGKPNVGKSSTINSFLEEERLIVSDIPGTTVDSIDTEVSYKGKNYLFVDTAGVRKKSKVTQKEEKFSVIKSFDSLQKSDLCLFLLDSKNFLKDQDLTIFNKVLSIGRGTIIVVNKSDLLSREEVKSLSEKIKNQPELKNVPVVFYSAKEKTGIRDLFNQIYRVFENTKTRLSTNKLNSILKRALDRKTIPFKGKFKPKIRYVHKGSSNPHTLIFHGNSLEKIEGSYERFLKNFYLK
ncbi:MAG: ribosome biogenesis GTPase Der, partial [Pseudomonadota bacterium]|nr:ribosome biogenesis GTPase Der [Pseudomonadota bacterium]